MDVHEKSTDWANSVGVDYGYKGILAVLLTAFIKPCFTVLIVKASERCL